MKTEQEAGKLWAALNRHRKDPIAQMIGQTFVSVTADDEEMVFLREDGTGFKFYHDQDCCESVVIDDISGDLNDLIGRPIWEAEERVSCNEAEDFDYGSNTWTFYTFRTLGGSVDVRWHGQSNGYYSERVDFEVIPGPTP